MSVSRLDGPPTSFFQIASGLFVLVLMPGCLSTVSTPVSCVWTLLDTLHLHPCPVCLDSPNIFSHFQQQLKCDRHRDSINKWETALSSHEHFFQPSPPYDMTDTGLPLATYDTVTCPGPIALMLSPPSGFFYSLILPTAITQPCIHWKISAQQEPATFHNRVIYYEPGTCKPKSTCW